jgi:hypothetical protein
MVPSPDLPRGSGPLAITANPSGDQEPNTQHWRTPHCPALIPEHVKNTGLNLFSMRL